MKRREILSCYYVKGTVKRQLKIGGFDIYGDKITRLIYCEEDNQLYIKYLSCSTNEYWYSIDGRYTFDLKDANKDSRLAFELNNLKKEMGL